MLFLPQLPSFLYSSVIKKTVDLMTLNTTENINKTFVSKYILYFFLCSSAT